MEVTLQDLIASIKKDGVEAAEAKADDIIQAATAKAEKIVSDAKKEAEGIMKKADEAVAVKEQGSISSVKQASRDILLGLQKSIIALFETILKTHIDSKLKKDDFIADLIKAVLQADLLAEAKGTISLPAKQSEAVKKLLMQDMAETLKKGIEIKPVKTLSSGFKIEEKDGSGYYGVTPEILAEMVGKYVNPELNALIQEAVKGA